MSRVDELLRDNEALRDRLARLGEASLCINESLDFDEVLQGVLDSARALTGARYGVISVLDGAGRMQDFFVSGLNREEYQQVVDLPDGPGLLALLTAQTEPLRLRDFFSHIAALGFPEFRLPLPVSEAPAFLVAPIRCGGELAAHIYLVDTADGREFTAADEETLVMFAAQAALVIANARTHRDEQRARADLETLVDTSPVGVVVLDVKTGAPVSFNLEAQRIVSGLHEPDVSIEQLLEVVAIGRADGREISLEDLSMAQALSAGETVRSEEIVLRVPDGRSVSALMNATPIRSDGGDIETFVVTMQDLTPLKEMERLRAEFLAMVSHELRTPLTSIRGSVTTLLDDASALHPTEMRQFHRIILEQSDRMRALVTDLLDVARIETGALSVDPEPTEVAVLVDEARRGFRSGGGRHGLHVDVASDLPWVMADRARVVQVLGNLLANAARHSPPSSTIAVSAARADVHIAISVSDEGRGIPAENLPHLFGKFSRIHGDDQAGDTGLGLAICKGIVEAHGGRIHADSEGLGLGARFAFTLPTVEEAGYASPAAPAPSTIGSSPRWSTERVRILAVDDDPQALRFIRDTLVASGYEPIAAASPQEALELAAEQAPQLALVDFMLPGTDGIELMRDIVKVRDVPVIFVSAYGQDQLVAGAFDAGAADYVVKPFSRTELVARIKAALRKRESPALRQPYVAAELVIDYAERRVTLAGAAVRLTAIEYRTLAELSANAGRVVTYEMLLRRVWGEDGNGNLGPLRTVINTLRRRLGDQAGKPTYIFTEPRVGYRMPRSEQSTDDAPPP